MFGLEAPLLPTLYVLAGLSTCLPQAPPDISIRFTETPLEYEYDVTLDDDKLLHTENIETSENVHGLTIGHFDMVDTQDAFQLGLITDENMGTSCMWLERIKLQFEISHKIYLSRDIEDDCTRQRAAEHQMTHVEADFALLKKFSNDLRLHLKHLAVTTSSVGPVMPQNMKKTQEKLWFMLSQKVAEMTAKFKEDRMRMHAALDAPEKTDALFNSCEERRAIIERQQ